MSFAVINTIKAILYEKYENLSVGEYTNLIHNAFLYQRFLSISGFEPDPAINQKIMDDIIELSRNAA
jgi:hypothetical protein